MKERPDREYSRISVLPLTTHIGAEVRDADLRDSLDEEAIREIREALVRWKVVFFRGQTLDADSQAAFGRRLGPLTRGHPFLTAPDGNPLIMHLDASDFGRADHWHTDVTFTLHPVAISILRAMELPELGGDTMWASTELAYERLPASLQRLAEDLRVIHTNAYDYGRDRHAERDPAVKMNRDRMMSMVFETEHPMVRIHPESGRKSLLLGGFAQQIVGLPSGVSTDLLRIFESYVLRPENYVRWRWRPGDVAMWDNRSTQHYAVNDYGDAPRQVERVTVAGDLPVGVDGRPSESLLGDDTEWRLGPVEVG